MITSSVPSSATLASLTPLTATAPEKENCGAQDTELRSADSSAMGTTDVAQNSASTSSMSRAAAQAADTLAVGISWEAGSASEYPSQGTHSINGDINLTLPQVRPARGHTTLTN
jgi:hypothetical protein